MFFKKSAELLDLTISNKELKLVQNLYERGDFREAKKNLKSIDTKKLIETEKKEFEKLTSMLKLDFWGITSGIIMLFIVIYLFIDYT
jgi:hypothetical protein